MVRPPAVVVVGHVMTVQVAIIYPGDLQVEAIYNQVSGIFYQIWGKLQQISKISINYY